jgi:hypothetical protein
MSFNTKPIHIQTNLCIHLCVAHVLLFWIFPIGTKAYKMRMAQKIGTVLLINSICMNVLVCVMAAKCRHLFSVLTSGPVTVDA